MHSSTHKKPGLLALAIGSIGVVYGDIGTSPLYAFKESLHAATGGHSAPQAEVVLGVLSLILWTLIIIVTLKYVTLLMRADNNGEGGILSLMALAQQASGGKKQWITILGISGAAFFYGDAIITPAISVLSAMEGLKLITNQLDEYIIPIAYVIIIGLFLFQKFGTEKVSILFGPIMMIWFAVMAWGGLIHIKDSPEIWKAINPSHAVYFATHHGIASLTRCNWRRSTIC